MMKERVVMFKVQIISRNKWVTVIFTLIFITVNYIEDDIFLIPVTRHSKVHKYFRPSFVIALFISYSQAQKCMSETFRDFSK